MITNIFNIVYRGFVLLFLYHIYLNTLDTPILEWELIIIYILIALSSILSGIGDAR